MLFERVTFLYDHEKTRWSYVAFILAVSAHLNWSPIKKFNNFSKPKCGMQQHC